MVEERRRSLPVAAAAAIASVSRRTMYNWMEKGLVEYTRTASGSRRIFEDTLFKAKDKHDQKVEEVLRSKNLQAGG